MPKPSKPSTHQMSMSKQLFYVALAATIVIIAYLLGTLCAPYIVDQLVAKPQ